MSFNSISSSSNSYPRAIGDSPPPSPKGEKKSNSRKPVGNSLISTIDSSTEIIAPNRGTVKVELNSDNPNKTKVTFPMGPFTMTAAAWPGEDYAAHGFVFKDGCWTFPDASTPISLEPESRKSLTPPKPLSSKITPKNQETFLDKLKRYFK